MGRANGVLENANFIIFLERAPWRKTSNFIIFLEKGYRVPYPLISRYFLPLSLFSCPLCAKAHNSARPRPSGIIPCHALLKSVGLRVYPCPCTTPRRTCPLRSSPRCTRLRCSLSGLPGYMHRRGAAHHFSRARYLVRAVTLLANKACKQVAS